MVLFRHNLPQPTQAQLMRGEFPKTLCIEQGVVLSFRFAERKVRRAPGVLRMAVVSQSSVKFGKKRVLLVGATNFKCIVDSSFGLNWRLGKWHYHTLMAPLFVSVKNQSKAFARHFSPRATSISQYSYVRSTLHSLFGSTALGGGDTDILCLLASI